MILSTAYLWPVRISSSDRCGGYGREFAGGALGIAIGALKRSIHERFDKVTDEGFL
jgi:hypothetical protein